MSASASCPFKHYDRDLIRDDLEQRVTFSRDFLRFDEESGKTLNSVASVVAPLVKPVVDQVYVQVRCSLVVDDSRPEGYHCVDGADLSPSSSNSSSASTTPHPFS